MSTSIENALIDDDLIKCRALHRKVPVLFYYVSLLHKIDAYSSENHSLNEVEETLLSLNELICLDDNSEERYCREFAKAINLLNEFLANLPARHLDTSTSKQLLMISETLLETQKDLLDTINEENK